jgi:hypothetical protein
MTPDFLTADAIKTSKSWGLAYAVSKPLNSDSIKKLIKKFYN